MTTGTDLIAPEPPDPPPPRWKILQPEFKVNRSYKREDYADLFDGIAELPNFEPMEVWQVAKRATSFYGWIDEGKYVKLPGTGAQRSWTRGLYLLVASQGANWTGEGYILTTVGYGSGPDSVAAGKFAICKHEKVEGFGANHERGWHPGHCSKCGLDMSVDSGD